MATLEVFETTLKEVVNAKRLSASKVEKLTELVLKLMEHDTQLVSILYRTHKSSSGTAKINSLYVFDALARAARHQVNKNKPDVHAIVGNCATFLIKVEGVLEGLFQDVLNSGHPESKEKTKKILDIWLKSNTFPTTVLNGLHKLVKETDKEKEKEPDKAPAAVTADPRIHATTSTTTQQQAQAAIPAAAPEQSTEALQSTLLALLSQAANASATPQLASNTANVPSLPGIQADPVQLALFKQLAQATNAGGSTLPNQRFPVPSMSVVPPSTPASIPPVASPVGGPSQNLFHRDIDYRGFNRREQQNDRFAGPPRGREPYYDNRDQRGGFRGAPRGRGRGRWDERNRQFDRNRGPEGRSQLGRNVQSRSRSPERRNGRDFRPYSPPRKQPFVQNSHSPPLHTPPADGPAAGKDEFGRDLRPSSPHEDSPAPTSHAPGSSPSRSASTPADDYGPAFPQRSQYDAISPSSTANYPPPPTISATSSISSSAPAGGLESFDLTNFDPTAPASWELLGKAWNVTHGYLPSQEELFQYVMSMNEAATFPIMSQYEDTPQRQWSNDQEGGWARNGPRRGGRGQRASFVHGHEYGNGRGGFRGRGGKFEQDTDALTLAGGDEPSSYDNSVNSYAQEQGLYQNGGVYSDQNVSAAGPQGGGHMEKVGDGWVWKESTGAA